MVNSGNQASLVIPLLSILIIQLPLTSQELLTILKQYVLLSSVEAQRYFQSKLVELSQYISEIKSHMLLDNDFYKRKE